MRLLDILRSVTERFEKAGIEDPLADAEVLVFHAAAADRLTAYMRNPETDGRLRARIARLVRRRIAGEPVQYIVGAVEFLGLRISVGKGVLIPRPETELLVREAIGRLRTSGGKDMGLSILDLCTGTGCIALSLARELLSSSVIGTDASKTAIRYAKKNAAANAVANVRFLRGPLFAPVKGKLFDLLISNPPYIKTNEIDTLQPEIRDWEPREALDGGRDGLDFYRAILSEAGRHLKPGGLLMLELGYDQAGEVRTTAEKEGYSDIELMKDYAGIERIFVGSAGEAVSGRSGRGSR